MIKHLWFGVSSSPSFFLSSLPAAHSPPKPSIDTPRLKPNLATAVFFVQLHLNLSNPLLYQLQIFNWKTWHRSIRWWETFIWSRWLVWLQEGWFDFRPIWSVFSSNILSAKRQDLFLESSSESQYFVFPPFLCRDAHGGILTIFISVFTQTYMHPTFFTIQAEMGGWIYFAPRGTLCNQIFLFFNLLSGSCYSSLFYLFRFLLSKPDIFCVFSFWMDRNLRGGLKLFIWWKSTYVYHGHNIIIIAIIIIIIAINIIIIMLSPIKVKG